ncbi:unnamed protein product [Acanthoscelides obtectus]|uniref:Uncharacterized protein n=1 Tax=Acanthoscelides obtectus TaxID=200917 RepID=A0A9P0P0J5_ACAOB|nr:unnamed protein product [Acanthoscelides obtectus]CAK1654052.1 hypothetical protein AOBTE_LOCUS18437 [Acanthoscelides obtectus]
MVSIHSMDVKSAGVIHWGWPITPGNAICSPESVHVKKIFSVAHVTTADPGSTPSRIVNHVNVTKWEQHPKFVTR